MNPSDTIPGRFAAIVKRQPDYIAISASDCEWTYRELAARAAAVAALIRTVGGQDGTAVALLVPHGPHLIAAILGVLMAGRIYLSIDPADPVTRLRDVIEHSGAECLLVDETTTGLGDRIATPVRRVLNLKEAATTLPGRSCFECDSESGAWLMYTSGSTGERKGVWQTHGGVAHLADAYARLIDISTGDRLSLLASCGLAASASAIFGALLNGATLCPFDLRAHGVARMLEWVKSQRITILHTVPTVFREAMRLSSSTGGALGLRWVRLGGEPVTRRDVELFGKQCPANCRLLQAYSSTETGLACAEVIDHGVGFESSLVPIGSPVGDATISIVDENGQPVGCGEPGRIRVESSGVAAGYWRASMESRSVFQTAKGGSQRRTFITSDLGRMNVDGTIEHLGRLDDQVKIRGRRVSLAAVDAGMRLLPQVVDVAAVAKRDITGHVRLIAFVVAKDQAQVDRNKLRRDLYGLVPSALIPDVFCFLDKLPQTTGGKTDRKALLNWKPVERPLARHVERPARDWFEKGLAAIWQDALGLRTVNRTDDFFELGGSSIELAQVISRIDKEFAIALTQSIFVEHPTIEQLGAVLADQIVQPGANALVRITGNSRMPPLVLVHGGKGDIGMFGQLARRIKDRPVFAFQSVGLNGEQWPLMSIPSMAHRYLNELKTTLSTEKCTLAGTCMGGLIALEMARQSRWFDAGGIDHVVLIDTELPARPRGTSAAGDRLIGQVRDMFRILRWGIYRLSEKSVVRGSMPAYRRFVHAMNIRARRQYRPRPFAGSVTIVCASQGRRVGSDSRLLLLDLAHDSKVVEVEGHRSRLFLPPAVDNLAGYLNALMSERSPIRHPS